MALFFLSTGSMAGISILTPVLSLMIDALSWRNTLLSFACFLTVVTIPLAFLVIRDDAPPQTDLLPEGQGKPSARPARALPPAETYAKLRVNADVRSAPVWTVDFGLLTCGYSMNLLGEGGELGRGSGRGRVGQ